MSPRPTFDVYIAHGMRELDNFPVHWLLVTMESNRSDNRCTFYHSTDSDARFIMDYRAAIEYGKRFDPWGIGMMRKIGVIREDINVLEFVCLTTSPQRCQMWVCAVLKVIEQLSYVESGTAAYWEARIEPRPLDIEQREIDVRWDAKVEPSSLELVLKEMGAPKLPRRIKRKRTD
ncbi:hypothetical protein BDV97DRAFT_398399 [Delphinella strobiligena]|nr:hypothetical protein BDV97DRAFT_398399 [Delphinella strobiligena]